jgi:hypothetical protein
VQANASTSVAGNHTDVSGERQNIGDGCGHIAYEIHINPWAFQICFQIWASTNGLEITSIYIYTKQRRKWMPLHQ